ncbi:MAG: SAM-dependent methyltransferase [Oscillospiraceae bacterium]|jgi:SAM-dependent methyltransferase|nr:SAM-dependent methyltransferase [Oscillospiraceae bacterium]
MDQLKEALRGAFIADTYKCVLSNPVRPDVPYKKIGISRTDGVYHISKYTDTQVFHENLRFDQTLAFIKRLMGTDYKSFNSWSADREVGVKVSKKGKALFHSRPAVADGAPREQTSHNRKKRAILKQGVPVPPLTDMGIFTKEGQVVRSMIGKYRQINRFIEIVDDEVGRINRPLTILDFGCGKSYLTFVLYYYFTEIKKIKVRMIGLDLKRDVIEKCNLAAKKYGYDGLEFRVGDIGGFTFDDPVDIMITLHACDTATDFALFNAVGWGAEMIFSVPCCQHELNAQIQSGNLALLTRYGIVRERFSSLVTDAIRCNLLECCGYRAQMVEFVAFDHTPKNIMLRAVRKQGGDKPARLAEVEAVIREFNLRPTLYRLLKGAGRI